MLATQGVRKAGRMDDETKAIVASNLTQAHNTNALRVSMINAQYRAETSASTPHHSEPATVTDVVRVYRAILDALADRPEGTEDRPDIEGT